MPNISLSTTAQTNPVWERARERANAEAISLSALAAKAITNYLAATDDAITVNAYTADRYQPVSFKGRWLVDPDDTELNPANAEHHVGIALTSKNRIAVWTASGWSNAAKVGMLSDFDDLTTARREVLSVYADQWNAAEMALQPIVWKDI